MYGPCRALNYCNFRGSCTWSLDVGPICDCPPDYSGATCDEPVFKVEQDKKKKEYDESGKKMGEDIKDSVPLAVQFAEKEEIYTHEEKANDGHPYGKAVQKEEDAKGIQLFEKERPNYYKNEVHEESKGATTPTIWEAKNEAHFLMKEKATGASIIRMEPAHILEMGAAPYGEESAPKQSEQKTFLHLLDLEREKKNPIGPPAINAEKPMMPPLNQDAIVYKNKKSAGPVHDPSMVYKHHPKLLQVEDGFVETQNTGDVQKTRVNPLTTGITLMCSGVFIGIMLVLVFYLLYRFGRSLMMKKKEDESGHTNLAYEEAEEEKLINIS